MIHTLVLLWVGVLAMGVSSHPPFSHTDHPIGELSSFFQHQNQPIHEQVRMTTRELTLNMSSINFPHPKIQGDNLNLSSITISKVGTACAPGYLVSSVNGTCELVDLLLMQNLQVERLVVGSLNLDQLRQRQQEFVRAHPGFNTMECQQGTPFLSRKGCIACDDSHPYFDLETLKCARCPENSSYNRKTRNCEVGERIRFTQSPQLQEKWTVQKGLGNIFGWTRFDNLNLTKRGKDDSKDEYVSRSTTQTTVTKQSLRRQPQPKTQVSETVVKSSTVAPSTVETSTNESLEVADDENENES